MEHCQSNYFTIATKYFNFKAYVTLYIYVNQKQPKKLKSAKLKSGRQVMVDHIQAICALLNIMVVIYIPNLLSVGYVRHMLLNQVNGLFRQEYPCSSVVEAPDRPRYCKSLMRSIAFRDSFFLYPGGMLAAISSI